MQNNPFGLSSAFQPQGNATKSNPFQQNNMNRPVHPSTHPQVQSQANTFNSPFGAPQAPIQNAPQGFGQTGQPNRSAFGPTLTSNSAFGQSSSAFGQPSAFGAAPTVIAPPSSLENDLKEKNNPRTKERKERKDKERLERKERGKNNNNSNANNLNNANNNNTNKNNNNTNNTNNTNNRAEKSGDVKKSSAKTNHDRIKLPRYQPTKFAHRARPFSNDAVILKPLPAPLTTFKPNRNSWDSENQRKMQDIERDYLSGKQSLQTAFDVMNPMRNKERAKMEELGLVDSTEVRKNLDDATVFVGSCLQMCPVFERIRRSLENNIYDVERGGKNGKISSERAVKAFCRPAAGNPQPLPSDVRPPNVLVSTLDYLSQEIVPQLPQTHAFLWDRTRSIRQDFTYQNYQGPEALWCFEAIARIHLVSLHVMAEAVHTSGVEWSQQQELEQLNKCLQSLNDFYSSLPQGFERECAGEMRAYSLISHFFDVELASSTAKLPICDHPLVILALELRSLASTSVPLFFQRVRKPDVPLLLRAIAEVHFNALRLRQLRMLHHTLHPRASFYSLKRFAILLGFNSEAEAEKFSKHYGISVSFNPEQNENALDLLSYDEAKVRSAHPLPQSFDAGLNMFTVDMLKGRPDASAAPALPSSSALLPPGPTGGGDSAGLDANAKRQLLQQRIAEKRAEQQRLQEEEERKQQQQQQLAEQQKQLAEQQQREQERLAEQQRIDEQRKAEQQRQQEQRQLEEQKQLAIRKEEQRKQEQMLREQQEREQQQQLALQQEHRKQVAARQAARKQFMDALGHRILNSVVNRVVESNSDMLVKSLKLRTRIAKERGLRALKDVYADRQAKKRRRAEIEEFKSCKFRRVSCNSSSNPPPLLRAATDVEDSIISRIGDDSASEIPSGFVDLFAERVVKPKPIEPMGITSADVLGNRQLVTKLEEVPNMRVIRVSADPQTQQGNWLYTAFGLLTDLPLHINLSDSTLSFVAEGECDAELIGDGSYETDELHVKVNVPKDTNTYAQLLDVVETVTDRFSWVEQQHLDTSRVFNHEHPLPGTQEPPENMDVDNSEIEDSILDETLDARHWLTNILADASDFM